jgi:hypothetical protein
VILPFERRNEVHRSAKLTGMIHEPATANTGKAMFAALGLLGKAAPFIKHPG